MKDIILSVFVFAIVAVFLLPELLTAVRGVAHAFRLIGGV